MVTLLCSSNHFTSLLYSTRVMKFHYSRVMKFHYSAQHCLWVITSCSTNEVQWICKYLWDLKLLVKPRMYFLPSTLLVFLTFYTTATDENFKSNNKSFCLYNYKSYFVYRKVFEMWISYDVWNCKIVSDCYDL